MKNQQAKLHAKQRLIRIVLFAVLGIAVTVTGIMTFNTNSNSRPSTAAEIRAQEQFQEKLVAAQKEAQQKIDAATKEAEGK